MSLKESIIFLILKSGNKSIYLLFLDLPIRTIYNLKRIGIDDK